MEAIATRVEGIATRVEGIATRVEAIGIGVKASVTIGWRPSLLGRGHRY